MLIRLHAVIRQNLVQFLEVNLYIHVVHESGWIFIKLQFFTATCDTKKEMVN